jgi:hypothetical protein
MAKHELNRRSERTDSQRQVDDSNASPMPRDPIEPDAMNPVQAPPADTEPEPKERPDLDWAEHED